MKRAPLFPVISRCFYSFREMPDLCRQINAELAVKYGNSLRACCCAAKPLGAENEEYLLVVTVGS